MIQYIIRRLLWGVVLLIAVIAITFVLFYLLPNVDPAVLRAGRNSSPEDHPRDRAQSRHRPADRTRSSGTT